MNSYRKAPLLQRRGYVLGQPPTKHCVQHNSSARWQQGQSVLLPNFGKRLLAGAAIEIQQSQRLYQAILEQQDCDHILSLMPYSQRLDHRFETLGSSINQGDDQEIETVQFDAMDADRVVAEDLWLKISWLSFHEDDASLRFRFSFGTDLAEDVAADVERQKYASDLTDAVFPESRVITENVKLKEELKKVLSGQEPRFVERIIYFNSPSGGAYLHHDRERGHAGVVYAQLTGATVWIALPKYQLLKELISFISTCTSLRSWPASINRTMQVELTKLGNNSSALSTELETFANSSLIHVINETVEFVQQLFRNGHGQILEAGDMLLLPQESESNCCWHSVFCLGDETGEALSFAIRGE